MTQPIPVADPGADSPRARRAICGACRRPPASCLCRLRVALETHTDVMLLQHPGEAGHAKNSARLAHLCLPRSELLVGERFEPAWLAARLTEGGRQPLLLYPDPDGRATAPSDGLRDRPLRLVVLDGTWRQSRQLLRENPFLAGLPRLDLGQPTRAGYLIRKAHRSGQLATMEAVALALRQLEPTAQAGDQLLAVFDRFVDTFQQAVAQHKQARARLEPGAGPG